jgi:hypothetical protein
MAVYVSCSLVAYETGYVGVSSKANPLNELVCADYTVPADQVLACRRQYLVAVRPWF